MVSYTENLAESPLASVEEILDRYLVAVDRLQESVRNPKADVPTLERHLLDVFIHRDQLKAVLVTPGVYPPIEIVKRLIDGDERLYKAVQKAITEHGANPRQWHYVFLGGAEKNDWWWNIDINPVLRNQEIVYENRAPLIGLLSAALLLLSLVIIILTSQRLWSRGLDWVAFLSIVVQVLVGGTLITDLGQWLTTSVLWYIWRGLAPVLKAMGYKVDDRFPLMQNFQERGWSLFAASSLFFIIVLFVTLVVFPGQAASAYNEGLKALRNHDLKGAETQINQAIQLQSFAFGAPGSTLSGQLTQLGDLQMEVGDVDSAQRAYEEALATDSQNVLVPYRLAEIYAQQGEVDHALQLLDNTLRLLDANTSPPEDFPIQDTRQLQEITYLTMITRARLLLEYYGASAAELALHEVSTFVVDHADLFAGNDSAALSTRELNILLGRMNTDLYIQSGCTSESYRRAAGMAWSNVLTFPLDSRTYQHYVWLAEARPMNVFFTRINTLAATPTPSDSDQTEDTENRLICEELTR